MALSSSRKPVPTALVPLPILREIWLREDYISEDAYWEQWFRDRPAYRPLDSSSISVKQLHDTLMRTIPSAVSCRLSDNGVKLIMPRQGVFQLTMNYTWPLSLAGAFGLLVIGLQSGMQDHLPRYPGYDSSPGKLVKMAG